MNEQFSEEHCHIQRLLCFVPTIITSSATENSENDDPILKDCYIEEMTSPSPCDWVVKFKDAVHCGRMLNFRQTVAVKAVILMNHYQAVFLIVMLNLSLIIFYSPTSDHSLYIAHHNC